MGVFLCSTGIPAQNFSEIFEIIIGPSDLTFGQCDLSDTVALSKPYRHSADQVSWHLLLSMLLPAQGQGRVAACRDQVLIKQAVLRTWGPSEDGERENGYLSVDRYTRGRDYAKITVRTALEKSAPVRLSILPKPRLHNLWAHSISPLPSHPACLLPQ